MTTRPVLSLTVSDCHTDYVGGNTLHLMRLRLCTYQEPSVDQGFLSLPEYKHILPAVNGLWVRYDKTFVNIQRTYRC